MGGKSTKTETKNEPPAWALPMIQGASNQWLGTIKGNAGNLSALSKELQGLLPQFRDIALNSNTLNGGKDYLNDVLAGKYLSEDNPYMQGMIDQTADDVGGRVNATFSAAGRTAGGANQQLLSKGLADAENSLRYTNYANERQAQQQAAGMMPSYRAGELAGLAPLLAAYQTSADLPYSGIKYLNGIGGLWNGYGTQTSTQSGGPSPLLGLLGAGLSGWASGGFKGI